MTRSKGIMWMKRWSQGVALAAAAALLWACGPVDPVMPGHPNEHIGPVPGESGLYFVAGRSPVILHLPAGKATMDKVDEMPGLLTVLRADAERMDADLVAVSVNPAELRLYRAGKRMKTIALPHAYSGFALDPAGRYILAYQYGAEPSCGLAPVSGTRLPCPVVEMDRTAAAVVNLKEVAVVDLRAEKTKTSLVNLLEPTQGSFAVFSGGERPLAALVHGDAVTLLDLSRAGGEDASRARVTVKLPSLALEAGAHFDAGNTYLFLHAQGLDTPVAIFADTAGERLDAELKLLSFRQAGSNLTGLVPAGDAPRKVYALFGAGREVHLLDAESAGGEQRRYAGAHVYPAVGDISGDGRFMAIHGETADVDVLDLTCGDYKRVAASFGPRGRMVLKTADTLVFHSGAKLDIIKMRPRESCDVRLEVDATALALAGSSSVVPGPDGKLLAVSRAAPKLIALDAAGEAGEAALDELPRGVAYLAGEDMIAVFHEGAWGRVTFVPGGLEAKKAVRADGFLLQGYFDEEITDRTGDELSRAVYNNAFSGGEDEDDGPYYDEEDYGY